MSPQFERNTPDHSTKPCVTSMMQNCSLSIGGHQYSHTMFTIIAIHPIFTNTTFVAIKVGRGAVGTVVHGENRRTEKEMLEVR